MKRLSLLLAILLLGPVQAGAQPAFGNTAPGAPDEITEPTAADEITEATAADEITEATAADDVTSAVEFEEQAPAESTGPALPIVREQRIEGLGRIEEDTVRFNVQQGIGVPLDPPLVAEDIRRLFALGYFSDVQVLEETLPSGEIALIYKVTEHPIVRSVTFSGNDEIEDEKIKEQIDIKNRTIFNEMKVRAIQQKLRDLYNEKGYNFTQVYPETRELPNNEVSINYRIEENLKVYVQRINFVGNQVYSADALKDILETKEYQFYSFLTSTGLFKEGSLDRDVDALNNLYLNNGYIKIRINKPKAYLSPDKKWVTVTYELEEGPQYFVGDIRFAGDKELCPPNEKNCGKYDLIFKESQVREGMKLKKGLPFSRERLGGDIQRISEKYQDLGYAFARVDPNTDVKDAERLVDITLQIDKGSLVYINQIRFKGNTKTRDKVIRRELLITEGQLFDGGALRDSRARAFALGFFEEVNFGVEPAGPDKVDVVVEVKERATGTLSAGVGYNSLDRFLGIAQVSFGNLMGYGIRLNTQAEFGARRQFYTISYTDPYFLDTKWSLGGDIFNNSRTFEQYTQRSIGGNINAGYLVYRNTRVFGTYRYEDISLGSFVGGGSNFFKGGATGSIGTSITRNTKNHPYDTSAGSVLTAGVEWAAPTFGGINSFVKYNFQTTYFYSPFWGIVLSTHEELGWGHSTVGGRLPFTERYFLGGITSLRGFNYRQIGPRTIIPGAGVSDFFQPIEVVSGGNKLIAINNELVYPIIPPAGIKGVFFLDAGNTYAEDEKFLEQPLRLGVGFGIRWFSPIGPLRFEWGFPLEKKPDEKKMVFEFSIGTFF